MDAGLVTGFPESLSGRPAPHDPLVAAGATDANLNDLAVLTAERIIAVGDRGVILVSESGGRNWRAIAGPTTANLYGVSGTEDGRAIAVGGWIGNYTRASHAVILRTQDAGQSWAAVACDQLPRLTGIAIQGGRLIAYGDYSPQMRSSVFESLDDGVSWHAIPSRISRAACLAGSAHGSSIVAVDVLGRSFISDAPISTSTNSSTSLDQPVPIATPDTPLRCMHHTGRYWLAGGDAGVLISSNDGIHWQNINVPLTAAASRVCRWHTIEQVGDNLWVAGFPGSIVLSSRDGGSTWTASRTGQTLPISAIRFVDENRGWATGAMGQILATRDGGQTWYAQRQHAQRLGVLAISDSSFHSPWLPMVSAAWDEQVAVASIVSTPVAPIDQLDFSPGPSAVLADIAPRLGLVGHWNWSSSSQTVSENLVWELRCWRPDVLLSSDSTAVAGGPGTLTNQAIAAQQQARSADGIATELDLPAWSVSKLVQVTAGPSPHFSEQVRRILRAAGLPIREFLLPLPPEHRQAAGESISLQTVWSISQANAMNASLLGGIPAAVETNRGVHIQSLGNYQLVMGRVHREKSMEQLARFHDESLETLDQWTNSLDFMLRNLPHREAAPLLHQLVSRLSTSPKHWPNQQVALERLTRVGDDAADWARIELLKQSQSDERAAWRKFWESRQQSSLRIATPLDKKPVPIPNQLTHSPSADSWNATPFQNPVANLGTESTNQPATLDAMSGSSSAVVPASAVSIAGPPPPATAPLDSQWFQLLAHCNRSAPWLVGRPDIELLTYRTKAQLASDGNSAHWSLLGDQLSSSVHLENLIQATQLIGWPQIAQQELLLSTGQIDRLRWKAMAMWADSPPRLDGEFTESFWNAGPPIRLAKLETPAGVQTTDQPTVRWAYDADYLYLAIDCPRDSSLPPEVPAASRDYDADLSGSDHLHLLLDTDRDYCTAIELAVSADGRTYDRCMGFSEYDPKWHVLVSPKAERWTAEIAIELRSLTTRTDLAGSAWSVSARRLNPHGSSQSWSQLRTHTPLLQAGGLLLFMPHDAQLR